MRYRGDPYWTVARWDGVDYRGNPVAKGTEIFYYPRTRTVMQGEDAKRASAEFNAVAEDEAFYMSQYGNGGGR